MRDMQRCSTAFTLGLRIYIYGAPRVVTRDNAFTPLNHCYLFGWAAAASYFAQTLSNSHGNELNMMSIHRNGSKDTHKV